MTLVALEKLPHPFPSMPAPLTSFGQNDFQERGIDVLLCCLVGKMAGKRGFGCDLLV